MDAATHPASTDAPKVEHTADTVDSLNKEIRAGLQGLLQQWDFQFKTSLKYHNSIGYPNSHPLLSPKELRLARIENSGPADLEKAKTALDHVLEVIGKRLVASFKHPVNPIYSTRIEGNEIIVSPSPTLVTRDAFDEKSREDKPTTFVHEDAQMMLGECRSEVDAIKLQQAIQMGARTFERAGVQINPKNNHECLLDLKFKKGTEADVVKEARDLAEAIAYGFGDVHVTDCRQTADNNIMAILNVGREWGTKALERYIPNVLKNTIPVESQAIASTR